MLSVFTEGVKVFIKPSSLIVASELRNGHDVSEMVRGVRSFLEERWRWDFALHWRSKLHIHYHFSHIDNMQQHSDSYITVTAYLISATAATDIEQEEN